MATTKKAATRTTKRAEKKYETHTTPTAISATSRLAVKVRDNYYTIEAHEERAITSQEGLDLDFEWKLLFDDINKVVDAQADKILDSVKNKK